MVAYTYLLLGLFLFVGLIIELFYRQDLIKLALKVGIIGGCAGIISEIFYTRDYWRPPSIFGFHKLSLEDFLFGFSVTALSAITYLVLFNYELPIVNKLARKKTFYMLFFIGLLVFIFLNIGLDINSIFSSSVLFFIFAIYILTCRKDLFHLAVYSTIIILCFVVLVYVLLFDFVAPNFWNDYWLLARTKYGITILGSLPLSELIWYFSWIFFASISYPFVSGKSLSKIKNS